MIFPMTITSGEDGSMATTKEMANNLLVPPTFCQPFPKCLEFQQAVEILIEVNVIKQGIEPSGKLLDELVGEVRAEQFEDPK